MATDRDDDVSRRYRALAREEPPAALDTAILAASRRAVRARPGGVRRWGPPLSIAAMLVLASGIVLRMQAEQPGVETSVPESRSTPTTSAPQAHAPAAPAASPSVESSPAAPEPQPPAASALVSEAKRSAAPAAKPPTAKRLQKTAPAAPSEMPVDVPREAPPAQRIPPTPAVAASPPPAAAPQAANAPAAAAADSASTARSLNFSASPPAARREAASEQRAKSAAGAGAEAKDLQEAQTPEAALERIAKLRAEGRDAEADRALESFRREHPDYRIPDALWERVRARPR
jgi:hypothetical protein